MTKLTHKPRIYLSAPCGFRTSTLLIVDDKCAGSFDDWETLDTVLRGRYDVNVGLFKKLLYAFVLAPMSIDMTIA